MNKLVLCCAMLLSIVLLAPSASAKKKSSFLAQLCEKCEYCTEDPTCQGCSECQKCETTEQEGCSLCRVKESEADCVERCTKGCRICGGKDGNGLESCKN